MKRLSVVTALMLIAASCRSPSAEVAVPGTAATSTTTSSTSTTTSTTTTSVSTTSTPTTTTMPITPGEVVTERDVPFTPELDLDVFAPAGPGPWPVAVLFHGGGWVGGRPADIEAFARRIAARGLVVFNAPYRLALQGGGFPESVADVSCALSFAHHVAPDYQGDPERLTVVGYSAGAHLGALAALAGPEFAGDCLVDSSVLPDAFVGIAGPYNTDALGLVVLPFFGTNPDEDPEPWKLGNPFHHVGKNLGLVARLVVGSLDPLWPMSEEFDERLIEAGYDSDYRRLSGVRHIGILSEPEAIETVVETAGDL